MKLLIILYFIVGCGKALTQFGGGDSLSPDRQVEGTEKNSEQVAEVRESTEIGNGNEADLEAEQGEIDTDPVVEPVSPEQA